MRRAIVSPDARGLSGTPEPLGPEGTRTGARRRSGGRGEQNHAQGRCRLGRFRARVAAWPDRPQLRCAPPAPLSPRKKHEAAARRPKPPPNRWRAFGAEEDASTGNLIVVTATKRERTLQDTPVAVSVTTAETIERAQIRDLRDLQTVVPSLSVGQRQSVANTNFFIRGFGNGANNAGIEPSVGVFVDGVYRSRTASQITDLPDVAAHRGAARAAVDPVRQERLGRRDLDHHAGAAVRVRRHRSRLTYGNFDQIDRQGPRHRPDQRHASPPAWPAGINKRDGFFRDLGTGDRTNERDRWFVRGQLLFDPGDGFKVRLIGDYDKIDENCCARRQLCRTAWRPPAIRALGGQVNAPADAFDNVVYNNFNSTNEIENYGFSGQVDYDLGDAFTLTSITAYRKTNAVTNQDSDFTSADLIWPQLPGSRHRAPSPRNCG